MQCVDDVVQELTVHTLLGRLLEVREILQNMRLIKNKIEYTLDSYL